MSEDQLVASDPVKTDLSHTLENLSKIPLNDGNARFLETAEKENGGDAAWRARKRREAYELLALSQIAPPGRLFIQALDLRESLRALLHLGVPVPCRPNEKNQLGISPGATLGLNYWSEAVRKPLPGYAFLQILSPQDVWLPAVKQPEQPLCLGATLPAGVRVRSLILMAYGAFSMQTIQIDEGDSVGVFNVECARWWQQNMDLIPLSKIPFLKAS